MQMSSTSISRQKSLLYFIYLLKKLNKMSTTTKIAYKQLADCNMDCSRQECGGFLRLFGPVDTCEPTYFQCSWKEHRVPNLRCKQVVKISHKSSQCSMCPERILVRDIISKIPWSGVWVHFACHLKAIQPSDLFAVCIRCSENIETELDAVPSFFDTSNAPTE